MRFRKLRIAWSVGWGSLALLLIALWVHSYWRCYLVSRSEFQSYTLLAVNKGVVLFDHNKGSVDSANSFNYGWEFYSGQPTPPGKNSFQLSWTSDQFLLVTPVWALLIATTLVAVLLGLIVAVLRRPAS